MGGLAPERRTSTIGELPRKHVQDEHETTPFVVIRGKVDNEKSGFPNIIAESFRPCPLPGFIEAPESHDFGR